MKYKVIIFDLDGVICHTDHYHYLAWKQLADRIGVHFDKEINNRLRGVSRMESLNIILENWDKEPFSAEQLEGFAKEKNEIYRQFLKNMTEQDLDCEVKATLDSLKNRGLKLAIGSSSKNASMILEQIGLGEFFDAVSDGNNITNSKPDPEVFLKAAQFLGIHPKDCLVVEDAKAGIQAATAANMDSAAIGDAYGFELATYNINRFSELLDCCNE